MSHQFRIYYAEEDLSTIEQAVQDTAGPALIKREINSSEPRDISADGFAKAVASDIKVYLAVSLRSVYLNQIGNESRWSVDVLRSEAVEFLACRQSDDTISAGRMYYTTGHFVGNEWVSKSEDFIHFADRLFKRTKGALTRDRRLDAYLGAMALRLREAGKIHLV